MTNTNNCNSVGQLLYDELTKPDNGTKKTTAKAFKELLDHLDEDKPISQYKLTKFKRVGILDKDNRISMEDAGSMIEWLLMCACYEGLIIRSSTNTSEDM